MDAYAGNSIKLTQYSKGAGCGCKIAPGVLEAILKSDIIPLNDKNLLVGNNTRDDAAVYDMGNGKAIISTTDFFMPIVDDAFDFGRIAAANAISDVYAMGGKPLMAIAILGWPVEKFPVELAQKILDGARTICAEAGIILAGGHSIDSSEPIFGLALTGEVEIKNLKKNSTAAKGCKLYLTKPIGTGIVTTAHKRELANEQDFSEAVKIMVQLNSLGYEFGKLHYVKSMTDITGFGLLGHLIEMCEASKLSAVIEYSKIPLLKNISHYVSKLIYPDITFRNWKSYEQKVNGIWAESLLTLCDPQTNGGLLLAIENGFENEFEEFSKKSGYLLKPFGEIIEKTEHSIIIN
jgi:selenide, water dikinase